MDQELGSIMAYLHATWPVKMYTDSEPENLERPSIYFPPPQSVGDEPFTSSSYQKTFAVYVKVFEHESRTAYEQAKLLADGIRKNRFLVPLVDSATGASTGRQMKISKIEERKMDFGVAQVMITWDSRYNYTFDTYEKIGTVKVDVNGDRCARG